MWVKWIRCSVDADQRAAFDEAQQAWRALAGLPGFILQVGGWNVHDNSEACILGLWADQAAYQAFMQHHHDRITDTSGQGSTYRAITVTFFDVLWQIDRSFTFAGAEWLHIAQYTVQPEQTARFLEIQREQWESTGAPAGLVARAAEQDQWTYFAASAWPARHSIVDIQAEAGVTAGDSAWIHLERLWRVV